MREGCKRMAKKMINPKQTKISRQSLANRFVHWTTALSVLLLIITGLGQLPLYTRYNVTKLPGAEWLGNYFITITFITWVASDSYLQPRSTLFMHLLAASLIFSRAKEI